MKLFPKLTIAMMLISSLGCAEIEADGLDLADDSAEIFSSNDEWYILEDDRGWNDVYSNSDRSLAMFKCYDEDSVYGQNLLRVFLFNQADSDLLDEGLTPYFTAASEDGVFIGSLEPLGDDLIGYLLVDCSGVDRLYPAADWLRESTSP